VIRPAAVLAAVVFLGVLAGCSEEPAPIEAKERPKLSRQEYLDRANAICRRSEERLDRLDRRLEGRRPRAVREAVREQVVPERRKVATDIRALNGPARLRRQVEPVLADVDRILDFVAQDPSRYDDLLFVDVDKEFTRLGITDCGE
jgi:hypothetical protein